MRRTGLERRSGVGTLFTLPPPICRRWSTATRSLLRGATRVTAYHVPGPSLYTLEMVGPLRPDTSGRRVTCAATSSGEFPRMLAVMLKKSLARR